MPPCYKVTDCNIVLLPGAGNASEGMTPVGNLVEIPFEIKRVFYLYDIPDGSSRGGHAHKQLEQYIIAVSGSFDITLDDGLNKKTVTLNDPKHALHLRPGIWKEMSNFSPGAVCLSLASEVYDEADYIRDYYEFKIYCNNQAAK